MSFKHIKIGDTVILNDPATKYHGRMGCVIENGIWNVFGVNFDQPANTGKVDGLYHRDKLKIVTPSRYQFVAMDLSDGEVRIDTETPSFTLNMPHVKEGTKIQVIRQSGNSNYIWDGKGLKCVDIDVALQLDGGCNHSWRTYMGFNDSFEYCTKCDEKRGKQ